MGGTLLSFLSLLGKPVTTGVTNPLPVTVGGSGASALQVQGNVASDAPNVGNPVGIGGVYQNNPVVVTDGDRVWARMTNTGFQGVLLAGDQLNIGAIEGKTTVGGLKDISQPWSVGNAFPLSVICQVFNPVTSASTLIRGTATQGAQIKPYALSAQDWSNFQNIAAAGTTAIVAAAGAGIRNFMTGLQITGVAATVATVVQIKDGATVIATFDIPAGASTVNYTFPSPLKSSVNTALNVTTSAAGPINFNAQGYTAAA